MRNETKQGHALEQGISALYQARDLLWQMAEEEGDAQRNAERWNAGGEGYLLLEQISAVLPPLEAVRDELLSQEEEQHQSRKEGENQ